MAQKIAIILIEMSFYFIKFLYYYWHSFNCVHPPVSISFNMTIIPAKINVCVYDAKQYYETGLGIILLLLIFLTVIIDYYFPVL